mmetsp:Transcript_164/g.685  ORF Transcript_164/g.685 Transcript_164/m.685 type:complete len:243 (-) Transcript_164:992-1720(-)
MLRHGGGREASEAEPVAGGRSRPPRAVSELLCAGGGEVVEGGREGAGGGGRAGEATKEEKVEGLQVRRGPALRRDLLLVAQPQEALGSRPHDLRLFAAGHHVPRVLRRLRCGVRLPEDGPVAQSSVHDVRPLEDPQEAQHRGHADGHRPDLPGERLCDRRVRREGAADGQGVQGPLRGNRERRGGLADDAHQRPGRPAGTLPELRAGGVRVLLRGPNQEGSPGVAGQLGAPHPRALARAVEP